MFYLYTDDDRLEIPDRLTREARGIEREDSVPLPRVIVGPRDSYVYVYICLVAVLSIHRR